MVCFPFPAWRSYSFMNLAARFGVDSRSAKKLDIPRYSYFYSEHVSPSVHPRLRS
jgi:hypothetical protein